MTRYAIVDIETTGSHAKGHGITEIAAIITDGTAEIERWETLVDPGLPIPLHITQLTGITNYMVEAAPTFDAIADELEEFLSGCVFVAHNVGFDYAFIRGHYETMGRVWRSPKLCTVRMARKLLPGHASYSLGRICEDLGIGNDARHRAMGDCAATVELFHRMMATERAADVVAGMLKRGERESWLPQHVPAMISRRCHRTGRLPVFEPKGHAHLHRYVPQRATGAYAFQRFHEVRPAPSVFARHPPHRPDRPVLAARLIEDELIRTHWPIHNRAQKSIPIRTAIVSYTDQRGFMRLHLQRQRHVARHRCSAGRRRARLAARPSRPAWAPSELLGLGSDGRGQTIEDDQRDAHNEAMNALIEAAQTARHGPSWTTGVPMKSGPSC